MAIDPARLYSALLNTGLQTKDTPLYQVIYQLIGLVLKSSSSSSSFSGGSSTTINNTIVSGGPPGADGVDGEDGSSIPGVRGLDGVAGAAGPIGPVFFIEDGLEGEPGLNIPVPGPTGGIGLTGNPGVTSIVLITEDGIDGQDSVVPGTQGIQGIQGVQGASGFDGDDGQDSYIPGPAGVPNVKQTEIDFGTTPVSEASFTITDSDVTATSQIIGTVAYEAPTGKDLDELEMDALDLKFGPGAGQFTLYVVGQD